MKFHFIDQAKKGFPVFRLCYLMGVSQSGYFAWKDRPISRRLRADLVMQAHVRSARSFSKGTYGSPRMTRELEDQGFAVGRRRIARLMRENKMHARQKRCFKKTTDIDMIEIIWMAGAGLLDSECGAVQTAAQLANDKVKAIKADIERGEVHG